MERVAAIYQRLIDELKEHFKNDARIHMEIVQLETKVALELALMSPQQEQDSAEKIIVFVFFSTVFTWVISVAYASRPHFGFSSIHDNLSIVKQLNGCDGKRQVYRTCDTPQRCIDERTHPTSTLGPILIRTVHQSRQRIPSRCW
jgi:hypothetical protein